LVGVGSSWYVGTNSNPNGATYRANGQLATLLLGNGKTTTYSYDDAFRVTDIVNDSGFQDLAFIYDKVGNITRITDAVMAGGLQRQNFTYDSLNRVTTAFTGGSQQGDYDDTYEYDVMGNLVEKTGVGVMEYGQQGGDPDAPPHAVTHVNDAQQYWYDGNGNMSCRIEPTADPDPDYKWKLEWTVENQLRRANGYTSGNCPTLSGTPNEVVEFRYDAGGMMLVRSENGQSTVHLGKLFQHNLTTGVTTNHLLFNGMLVAQNSNANFKFFLTDHLGGVNTTLRADGTEEADLRYDPWGKQRWSQGTTPTGYRYTGQRDDDKLGLYDYNARYYDANIGRFISADTIIPQPNNPQSFNRYTYVLNNPLGYIDPTGHRECSIETLDCSGGPGSFTPPDSGGSSFGDSTNEVIVESLNWISSNFFIRVTTYTHTFLLTGEALSIFREEIAWYARKANAIDAIGNLNDAILDGRIGDLIVALTRLGGITVAMILSGADASAESLNSLLAAIDAAIEAGGSAEIVFQYTMLEWSTITDSGARLLAFRVLVNGTEVTSNGYDYFSSLAAGAGGDFEEMASGIWNTASAQVNITPYIIAGFLDWYYGMYGFPLRSGSNTIIELGPVVIP
jgi:RHS repeat-associated protein